MGKIVFMFPGQGAQYVGMGKDFYDSFACSKEIFDKANEVLDIDVKKLCFEENEDINITEYTQAAMVTASVAILKKIEEMGLKPDLTAGLSLGEYCALVASDVMSFEDAVKVVRQRGILMQDTVPAGEGAMSAVLGMKKEAIEAVLPDVEGIVTIANYNCPGQIVISGESKAVAEAGEALKEAGAKRVLPLKVSGPFHSPMLKPAGEKLLDVLADVEVDDPTVPYVSNTTAEFITSKDEVKELLGRQVYSSVCWEQSIEKMIADGADTFVEIGPGRTLCGFMRKIDRNVKAINIAKVEDLEKIKGDHVIMLSGKVAIVTGASRGIGRETALTLAGYGATVIVNYCGSKDKAEAVVEEIIAARGNSKSISGRCIRF